MEPRFLHRASLLLLIAILTSAIWRPKFEASTCYEHYNYYHNVCDPNTATPPMSRGSVSTFLACPARCQLKKGCMAFFFSPGSEGERKGICLTYNVTSNPVDMACRGSVYGQFEKASCRPSWSEACDSSVDCLGANRTCQDMICTCEVGFMFEPNSGDCVAECDAYSDTFSEAKSTYFETPDNITLTGFRNNNECKDECLRTDCRSYQFKPKGNVCVLSNLTLAIAGPESTAPEAGNHFYQRECLVSL